MAATTPGKAGRVQMYEAAREDKIKDGSLLASDTFFCDSSQNADSTRARIGQRVLPTLTCSTQLQAHHIKRELLLTEHLVAQGIRGARSDGPFQLPGIDLVENSWADQDMRIITGNGQNICQVVPLHLFIYGHAIWK